jgi:hypothetical protein
MPGTRAPRQQRTTKDTKEYNNCTPLQSTSIASSCRKLSLPQRILLTQKDTGIFPINITKQHVGLVLKIIMSPAVSQLTAASKIVSIPTKSMPES